MMASISPSAQNEREQWSIQILRALKREMPSPSDLPRQPTWVGLEAMLVAGGLAVVHVDVDAVTVDGLEAVDNELVFELNGHVGREDDPEGFVLDDGVAERARSWVRWVGIGGVGDYVDQAEDMRERRSQVGEEVDGPICHGQGAFGAVLQFQLVQARSVWCRLLCSCGSGALCHAV
ncbi:hypothetical protein ACFX19_032035 [Malus domestica]